MVILWTFGHQESKENLGLFFNYLESKGIKVYSLDIDGNLRHKISNVIFKVPRSIGFKEKIRYNDIKNKWKPVIETGFESYRLASADIKYKELENQALFLIKLIRPDFVVVWNPLAPNFGVLGDVSLNNRIRCIYSERGVFPGTVILDSNGLWKKAKFSLAERIDKFNNDGTSLTESWNLLSTIQQSHIVNFDSENVEYRKFKRFRLLNKEKKLVAIIGSPLHEHSIVKESFISGISGLPICENYFEMLDFLLNRNKDCVFVFKAHPHTHKLVLPISERLIETQMDAVLLMQHSDYIILNGSKLEIMAFMLKKPILLAGNGLLWKSGVSSDFMNLGDLSDILKKGTSELLFDENRNLFAMSFYNYVTQDLFFYSEKSIIDTVELEYNFQKFKKLLDLKLDFYVNRLFKRSLTLKFKLAIVCLYLRILNKLRNIRSALGRMKNRVIEKWHDFILQILFLRKFYNKTVALVGNSAALSQSNLGGQIDEHNIVVRFNVALTEDRENAVGRKTDLRFIGLTISDKWLSRIKSIPSDDIIWSFSKNLDYYHKEEKNVIYIPTYFQKIVVSRFNKKYKNKFKLPEDNNPPRSGIIFLLLLILFGRAKSVSIFGFSTNMEDSLKCTYENGEIKIENKEEFSKAHCDPDLEIIILKMLAENKLIKIY